MNNVCSGAGVGISISMLESAKANYRTFISSCEVRPGEFRLTPKAEVTPYALCFALFGLKLLGDEYLYSERDVFIIALRKNVRKLRARFNEAPIDKPYRQLLTFTLSALSILNALDDDPLEELVLEQLPSDLTLSLKDYGILKGQAQSGNQSMFLAIFLLHARDYLNKPIEGSLSQWVDLHFKHMNRFGFWGESQQMTHLQFQNGYHQYEILEYLDIENPKAQIAIEAVRSLADSEGHFAPYPGGGGCYDYDAVFVLTSNPHFMDKETALLLNLTAKTLLTEQTQEGGWCESQRVRPRNLENLMRSVSQIARAIAQPALLKERLRYAVALQRPRHNRIHTHWSTYSRAWGEADLWDSWFRLLTVARIQVTLDPTKANDWGFIDYPGIGYHPSVSRKNKGI